MTELENEQIAELNSRMTEIEIKFSYLEDFLNKLQNIAVEHDKTIDQLKAENLILKQKVRELVEAQEGDIPNRRPPHY
ncbi:MAG: SlyX family protein [Treponemataceae bacterium]|nr:SlyX family protein [Treponemataceae bacterium]